MKITKDIQAQARRLMRLCMSAEGLLIEENVRKVADGITAAKPRNYIALLTAFTNLVRLEQESRTATVTSAVPLSDSEKNAICARLNARKPGLIYSRIERLSRI